MRSRLTAVFIALLPLLLAVPFFWRLDAEEFHGDESHWITSGQQAWYLVTSGQFTHPQWRDEFYFYSQPQTGKLLIGAALAAAGRHGPEWIVEYDWHLRPSENRAIGRVPSPDAVLAGRIPGAIAGWVTCLLVWLGAARLGFPTAGPLAAVLLATHPLWLANSRRAGLDAVALCLGLATALVALEALRCDRTRSGRPSTHGADAVLTDQAVGQGLVPCRAVVRQGTSPCPTSRPPLSAFSPASLGLWALCGVLLGFAASTKYVAFLAALLAVPAAFALLVRGEWRQPLIGASVALPIAAAVFYAANPALYGDPVGGLGLSLGFLAEQAEGMRHSMPGFRSPLWVAAEIVDRAVWPLGFPRVVESSMPEPLVPGSYGTPIVALGAGIALLVVARRRAFPRTPTTAGAMAASWAALVYVLLVFSVPTWWERWHLPLVLPLVLLAACGLAVLPRAVSWSLAGAQAAAALAMLPSFLGRGWGALVLQPVGAIAHLAALALALATLVSLCLRSRGGTPD